MSARAAAEASSLGEALVFSNVTQILKKADTIVDGNSLSLAGVKRFDSAGVALLLELTRRARKCGKKLELRDCPAQVRSLLEFFEVDRMLDLQPNPPARA